VNAIADALAAKRITRLVVEDEILSDFRDWIWKHFPPESNKFGYLFTCHACTSVWAAALVRSGLLPGMIRDTLALSECVLIAQRAIDQT
jgi:hypothetical protein